MNEIGNYGLSFKTNLILYNKDGLLITYFYTVCPFYDLYNIFKEILIEINKYDK
jgi:hypothetical protein